MPKESIGELVIEFGAEGADEIQQVLEEIGAKAKEVGAAVSKVSPLGEFLSGGVAAGAAVLSKAVGATVDAISSVADSLWGLARAGIANSKEGERIAVLWERLSRILGGVFAPILDKFAETLEDMTGPIEEVAKTVGDLIGQIMDGLAPVFEVVIKLVKDFLAVLRDFFKWISEGLEAMGLSRTNSSGHRELTPRGGGGVENFMNIYSRVAQAALRSAPGAAAKSPAEEIRDLFREFMNFRWIGDLISGLGEKFMEAVSKLNPFKR